MQRRSSWGFPRGRWMASFAAILLCILCCAIELAHAAGPTETYIRYEIDFDPIRQALCITVSVRGLDATQRNVSFHLANWGEWTQLDSLYLRLPQGEPPVRRDADHPTRLRIEVPEQWDGSATLTYHIPLAEFESELHRRQGLLPWISHTDQGVDPHNTYALCFSNNTLMSVHVDDRPVAARRTIRLSAPPGIGVTSGWRGYSPAEQIVTLERDIDKTPVLFGTPAHRATSNHDDTLYEVIQFSRGEDVTGAVLELIRQLIPSYATGTGRPLDKPVRVFVTDTGGGQKTDNGLLLQPWHETPLSPYYKHLVAHELFHEWLGGFVAPADDSTIWFLEGFTDYLSLWHLAAIGEIEWTWFADRLEEIDHKARSSEAHGRVRFNDPTVRWRDYDGPIETLAYKGGAVLAFAMDVQLRKTGHAGLTQMIGDLIVGGDGTYTLESIRTWMAEHGLGEFYAAYIEQPTLPDFHAHLADVGLDRSRRIDEDLSYLGVRIDGDMFGTVLAIDPDGPAAHSGLRIGDTITGCWPARSQRPQIDDAVDTPYPYALDAFATDGSEINIGYLRDGNDGRVRIRPMPIPGGYWLAYEIDQARAQDFFRLEE